MSASHPVHLPHRAALPGLPFVAKGPEPSSGGAEDPLPLGWFGNPQPHPSTTPATVSGSLFDLQLTVLTIFLKTENSVASTVERNFARAVYVSVRKHLGTLLFHALLAFVKFPCPVALAGRNQGACRSCALWRLRGAAPPESGFSEAPPRSCCGQLQGASGSCRELRAAFSLPASLLTPLLTLAAASLIRSVRFHSG